MCAANTKASMHKYSFTTHCHWGLTSHVPVGEDTDERIPMQADGAKGAVVARVERAPERSVVWVMQTPAAAHNFNSPR